MKMNKKMIIAIFMMLVMTISTFAGGLDITVKNNETGQGDEPLSTLTTVTFSLTSTFFLL